MRRTLFAPGVEWTVLIFRWDQSDCGRAFTSGADNLLDWNPVGTIGGKEDKPEYGLGAEATKIEFSASEGDQTTTGSFVIGAEKDGKFYAKASGNPFIVTVPKYAVQPFLDATPDILLEAGAAAPTPAPPADGAAPPMPPTPPPE